jgi:serine/threonine-protein kinase RsbW
VIGHSELRLNARATPAAARPLRHALAAFLAVYEIEPELLDDILTAVGEALANAVEHAYPPGSVNDVELVARVGKSGTLEIDVYDRGSFLERGQRPGRGFGLRIVRAIARQVTIDTDGGTHVHMIFDVVPRALSG